MTASTLNRVEKANGKLYWYGAGTEILDESDGTGSATNSNFNEYIFFGVARIARRDASGNALYYVEDHLGSSRVMAEVPSGQASAALCYDADFYPFGGEIVRANTCPQNYKFEGHERDAETELDDFGARYYDSGSPVASAPFGRFMSADPDNAGADQTDPQSWNAYDYARNNPITNTDLDGRACVSTDGGKTYHDDNSGGQTCGQANDPANSNKPNVIVSPSLDELKLMMLQSIGETMSSPRYWADLVKNGLENTTTGGMIAGTVEQCTLSACSKADVAVAALPLIPIPDLESIAEAIADGHAFEKHAAELGVASEGELKALIQKIVENANTADDVRQLTGGRVAFWDDTKKAVVIFNPNAVDKGTIFVPAQGRHYFDAVLK